MMFSSYFCMVSENLVPFLLVFLVVFFAFSRLLHFFLSCFAHVFLRAGCTIQRNAMQCNSIQCNTTQDKTRQHNAISFLFEDHPRPIFWALGMAGSQAPETPYYASPTSGRGAPDLSSFSDRSKPRYCVAKYIKAKRWTGDAQVWRDWLATIGRRTKRISRDHRTTKHIVPEPIDNFQLFCGLTCPAFPSLRWPGMLSSITRDHQRDSKHESL